MPYVTVYGLNKADDYLININTASIPVIMSLDERITEELAERIVKFRDITPFDKRDNAITDVAGFEGNLGISVNSLTVIKSSNFRITSVADENGIKRIIESVVEIRGNNSNIIYWVEM